MPKKKPSVAPVGHVSVIDVANTVLQEAFREKLRLGPKQLFAAVMEIHDFDPELFGDEKIVLDHARGRAPSSLRNKFATVPVGPITRYIPNAAGQRFVIPELVTAARRALGFGPVLPGASS